MLVRPLLHLLELTQLASVHPGSCNKCGYPQKKKGAVVLNSLRAVLCFLCYFSLARGYSSLKVDLGCLNISVLNVEQATFFPFCFVHDVMSYCCFNFPQKSNQVCVNPLSVHTAHRPMCYCLLFKLFKPNYDCVSISTIWNKDALNCHMKLVPVLYSIHSLFFPFVSLSCFSFCCY